MALDVLFIEFHSRTATAANATSKLRLSERADAMP
jgi:hypothetical protein